jgi:hypothetical protein
MQEEMEDCVDSQDMVSCSDIGYESNGINSEIEEEKDIVVTNDMFKTFKEELKEEREDLVRFLDYTIQKNKVDNVRFYKEHYSFSFKKKEVEVESPVTQSPTGSFSTTIQASNSNSYDKLKGYEVSIYQSYVTIKIEYNETMINGVDDIFEKYKQTFFNLYTKQEKLKASDAIGDIYEISGLDLKKSREDKINSVLE